MRLLLALLALALAGTLAPERGANIPRAPRERPAIFAPPAAQETLAPGGAPEVARLLHALRHPDVRDVPRRLVLGGPARAEWSAPAATTRRQPRPDARPAVVRPPLGNRAPYDATAPPVPS